MEHPVAAEIPDRNRIGGHHEVGVTQVGGLRARLKQSSDLGGQHELLARTLRECSAEAPFGEASAVIRCGVEVANPGLPGGFDGGIARLIRGLAIEVAELRCAKAELGEVQGGGQRSRRHRSGSHAE